MLGIREYIDQNIGGKAIYNPPKWVQSFDLSGTSICEYKSPKGENVKYIIVNLIQISFGNTAVSAQLKHRNTDNNIFEIVSAGSQLVISPFNYIVMGDAFNFSVNDDSIRFSLNITTVTLAKK